MGLTLLVFSLLAGLQGALIVTGGAVRLTGSGLGCPTWPQCTPGSFTPIPHQIQGTLHSWVEFGNRLLTFVLFIVAIAALVLTIRRRRQSSQPGRSIKLAVLQLVGILGQGFLGGITVLTHLNPIPVAAHFLLSIALISGAWTLRHLVLGKPTFPINGLPKTMITIMSALSLVVITVGTVVTGSGPHAGDITARRFPFNPQIVSWIHADTVIALIALTFSMLLHIKFNKAALSSSLVRTMKLFFVFILVQGAIGYLQYFTGLPELLVGAHLLGSTLIWTTIWNAMVISDLHFFSPSRGKS